MMKVKEITDVELINRVKKRDDQALCELYYRYEPIVKKIMARYFIRNYELTDWQQDALLICYETACIFDPALNLNFGGLFKLKLLNHTRSLLRFEMAQKRVGNNQAISYEAVLEEGHSELIGEGRRNGHLDDYLKISELDEFIASLSLTELMAFRYQLGAITLIEACQRANCEKKQIKNAYNRCYVKFRKFIR